MKFRTTSNGNFSWKFHQVLIIYEKVLDPVISFQSLKKSIEMTENINDEEKGEGNVHAPEESWKERLDPTKFDPKPLYEDFKNSVQKGQIDSLKFIKEFRDETFPQTGFFASENSSKHAAFAFKIWTKFIHIPYFPLLHRPGWLLRYLVGPYDSDWAESLYNDVVSGLTVGLTLIPQVFANLTKFALRTNL